MIPRSARSGKTTKAKLLPEDEDRSVTTEELSFDDDESISFENDNYYHGGDDDDNGDDHHLALPLLPTSIDDILHLEDTSSVFSSSTSTSNGYSNDDEYEGSGIGGTSSADATDDTFLVERVDMLQVRNEKLEEKNKDLSNQVSQMHEFLNSNIERIMQLEEKLNQYDEENCLHTIMENLNRQCHRNEFIRYQNKFDGTIVRGTGNDVSLCVLDNDSPVMMAGRVYEWTVDVTECTSPYLTMGVITTVQHRVKHRGLGHQAGGYGYSKIGQAWHDGKPVTTNLPTYGTGSKVHFRLDLTSNGPNDGTLSGRVEGKSDRYEILFTGLLHAVDQLTYQQDDEIVVGFHPAVSIYSGNVKFSTNS